MGKRQWTQQQLQAIEAKGTVLVSAAAGSGKTAVLVERIIRKITDKEHPVSADSLVVVTFTIAAAGEIKARIQKALAQAIAEHPGDAYFRRQQQLLERSHIGTIDAFCARLVKEYFYQLGISPTVRVGDENELRQMEEAALAQALSEAYKKDENKEFECLSRLISAGRNDRRLRDMILKLYGNACSRPFGKEWIKRLLEPLSGENDPLDTPWGQYIWAYTQENLQYCSELMDDLLTEAMEIPEIEKAYGTGLLLAKDGCDAVLALMEKKDWDTVYNGLLHADLGPKIGVLRGADDALKEVAESFKETYKFCKDTVTKTLPALFCGNSDDFKEDMEVLRKSNRLLLHTLLRFWECLETMKKEREIVDFSDIMDYTVRLVAKEEDGRLVPTDIAKQLSLRYEEIMIDEFQDTNEAQDLIFRCLSREEKNLFMVGDVKQSIYSFRQAMPQIFTKKRHCFPAYDGTHYPAKIDLDRNFRSKEGVIDSINGVFSPIMTERVGGADYHISDKLYPGATYLNQEFVSQMILLDKPGEMNSAEAQAIWVGKKIRDMLENTTVQDGDHLRPLQPTDVCIMMRSVSGDGDVVKKTLEKMGIHATMREGMNLFEVQEVSMLLSFLTVISNPLSDISLTHLLLSPLWGYTADDLAQLRVQQKKGYLYQAMLCSQDPKIKEVVQCLRHYRKLSTVTTVSSLLEEILRDFSYDAYIQSREDSKIAAANIKLFFSIVADWESNGLYQLSPFVRRVRSMLNSGKAPKSSSIGGDGVAISTIHKAKGLEYPVCFLIEAEKRFHLREGSDPVLVDDALGVGMKRISSQNGGVFSTVLYEAVKLHSIHQMLSEEMRVLYVALTRAREQLYIVACSNKSPLPASGKKYVHPLNVLQKATYVDWLLQAKACEGAFGPAIFREKVESEPGNKMVETIEREVNERDEGMYEEITRHMQFSYPHMSATAQQSKYTVSELVHQDDDSFLFTKTPSFAQEKINGASRGTAFHLLAQYCIPEKMMDDWRLEIQRLIEDGAFDEEKRKMIHDQWVERFSQSAVMKRMANAQRLYREFQFITSLDAQTLDVAKENSTDVVMLQGVVDCICVNGDKCTIVDYKTDRVEEMDVLAKRYGKQLEYYAVAIKDLLKLRVDKKIIYSVHLGEEIEV